MAIEQINSGSAPIKWSSVDDAFKIINENFTEIVATIGTYGVTPVDFTNLSTNIIPSDNGEYDLGSNLKRWRDLYLTSQLYIGTAPIISNGGIIQLPAGSKVGNFLLDEGYFKTISVDGQDDIVADDVTDTLTILGATGISLTTDSATDTLTIQNNGVVYLNGTPGQIGVSANTGTITLTNLGVTSIAAGNDGVSVSASTGAITISNSGIYKVITDPGSGISLDTSVANTVRITNSSPNIIQNTFRNINVAGQDPVIADSSADTLTLVAGSGITITTNATSDSITFENNGGSQLTNGSYSLALETSGSLTLPNLYTINGSPIAGVGCAPGLDTVVYTSVSTGVKTIKLLIQYEGEEDGGDGNFHTHSCDMIVVKRSGPTGIVSVDAVIYGSIYTSISSLATFNANWNSISNSIEVTARPVSLTNQGWVRVYATEITLAD